jgi:antitoxin MazE
MQTTVQKWGNSLALRLPKPFTTEINISENSTVDISIENNQIVIKPIKKTPINLDDLIAAITPDNLHSEIPTGQPIGNEIW